MRAEDTRVGMEVRCTIRTEHGNETGWLVSRARLVEDFKFTNHQVYAADVMYLKNGVYLTKLVNVYWWEPVKEEEK